MATVSATPKKSAAAKPRTSSLPLEEQIRRRAFELYLKRGGQDGSDVDDWLQAEEEIRLQREEEE